MFQIIPCTTEGLFLDQLGWKANAPLNPRLLTTFEKGEYMDKGNTNNDNPIYLIIFKDVTVWRYSDKHKRDSQYDYIVQNIKGNKESVIGSYYI